MIALAAAGSTRALWYFTRGTGVVSLLLLTAVILLGVTGVARLRSDRLPRFLIHGLHRNLTPLAIAFIVVHVVTAVVDGFAPIALTDAVIPFASPYRPVWLGLGAVAFDLLLAVAATSMLRVHVGLRTWRGLHWLAYASWPLALVHALGTGSDARVGWLRLLAFACTGLVAAAVLWRALGVGGSLIRTRAAAAAGAVLVPIAIVVWYLGGPGAPGWAARAGTPARLLGSASRREPPLGGLLQGTIVQSRSRSSGLVTVEVRATSGAARLLVWLRGAPLAGGGVSVRNSRLALGTSSAPDLYVGPLTKLDGPRLAAIVQAAGGARLAVSARLRIDRAHGRVTGLFQARRTT